MPRVRVAACWSLITWAAAAACGGDEAVYDSAPSLRVGATSGITRLLPGPNLSSSAASAIELVYEPLDRYGDAMSMDANTIRIDVRPSSPLPAERLAAAIRFEGNPRARAVDDHTVEVTFEDPALARSFLDLGQPCVDDGPFAVAHEGAGTARLQARRRLAIDRIDVVAGSEEEEWRWLLSRDIDVIPSSWIGNRSRFADVASVRVTDISTPRVSALFLNAKRPALADPATRRALLAALDPAAIARVLCGDADCAAPVETAPALSDAALPQRLVLTVLASDSNDARAAFVVRYQLRRAGVDVEVAQLEMADLIARGDAFDMTINPLPIDLARAIARIHGLTGWEDAEVDRAIETGDLEGARQRTRDAAVHRALFLHRYFAAVDRRFCGARPTDHVSWRWLADLRPCKPGESE